MKFKNLILYIVVALVVLTAFAGAVSANEVVETITCSDTDGEDIYTKGYAEGNWFSNEDWGEFEDYCVGTELVGEIFCNGDGYVEIVELECGEGYQCEGGECVESDDDYVQPFDSDGGKDYYTAGYGTGIYYVTGLYQESQDYCSGSGKLGEFFIKEHDGRDYLYVIYVSPPEGYVCEDGEFVSEEVEIITCSDSDSGKEIYERGKTRGIYDSTDEEVEYEDFCTSGGLLGEYYCNDNGFVDRHYYTPVGGYDCVDGEIVESDEVAEIVCTESDDGEDYYEKGETSGIYYYDGEEVEYEDYCRSDEDLGEYYCNEDGYVAFVLYSVRDGYVCEEGEIVEEDEVVIVLDDYDTIQIYNRIDDAEYFYSKSEEVYAEIFELFDYYEDKMDEDDAEDIERDIGDLGQDLEDISELIEDVLDDTEDHIEDELFDEAEELADELYDEVKDFYNYIDGQYDEIVDDMEDATDDYLEDDYNKEEDEKEEIVEEPVEVIVEEEEDCEDGTCELEGSCVDVGLRMLESGVPMYCDWTGDLLEQKTEGKACQNSFECVSNSCLSGQCEDLISQLEETNSMLEKIYEWLSGLFS